MSMKKSIKKAAKEATSTSTSDQPQMGNKGPESLEGAVKVGSTDGVQSVADAVDAEAEE